MKYLLTVYLFYWMILTERFTIEGLVIGFLVVFVVYSFNNAMFLKYQKSIDIFRIKNLKYWSIFVVLLMKEIVKANLQVAKIVLSPKMKISPGLTTIRTDLQSTINRVILANSITLTPGTLTINLEREELLVHCLEEASAKDQGDNPLEQILKEAEGKL